jgi:hypothetical protein
MQTVLRDPPLHRRVITGYFVDAASTKPQERSPSGMYGFVQDIRQ